MLFENLKDGVFIDQSLAWFPGMPCAWGEALLDYELRLLGQTASE
jgi:hypothetical protein